MATGTTNMVSRVTVTPILPVYPSTPTPDLPVRIRSNFSVEKIPFVDGSEQRIIETDENIKTIELRYDHLSEIDRNNIYKFFTERKGATEPFYWTNPINQDSHIVRFDDDMLRIENFRYKLYNLNEIILIETHWDY